MIEKIKSLSKDTLIYGTSTIIGRFLNFFLVPLYTNKFLPDEFGVVSNIYAYIAILNVFFTIGLESGYFKFASTLEVGTKKENFTHPFLGILINSFILSGILFFFSFQFTSVFQINSNQSILLKLTAVILFFDAIVTVPFAYLRLQHKPAKFALIRISNIVINVVMNVVLIVFLKTGIIAVFISNLCASAFTFLLLLPDIIKNFHISFNKALVHELLKFSLPYIPAGISANIVQVINRPILTYLKGDYAVGVFQANYRLGIFMMLFVSMFEFAWRPFFLQNAKEPDAKKLFSKIMTLFIIAGSVIFLVLSLFINDIAMFKLPFKGYLIGKAYWEGLNIVPLILLSYLFYGIYINLMAGIYIEKKTKYLPVISGAAAVVNIVANFILIPVYGIYGAAITTLLSYSVMTIGIFLAAQKFYYIKYEYVKIVIIFLILIICYGGYLFVSLYFSEIILLIKIISLLTFFILIFVTGVIDFPSLKKLRNSF
jgi:O-antigen/teichoic acid export membrane protein